MEDLELYFYQLWQKYVDITNMGIPPGGVRVNFVFVLVFRGLSNSFILKTISCFHTAITLLNDFVIAVGLYAC